MPEIYFQGLWRMDWGLGNPNKTAALIATLMIAVWALAYFRKWGFWLALILFSLIGIGLVHTFSRGGIIAALVGSIPLIFFAPRPWPREKVVAVMIALGMIIAAFFYWQAHERFKSGLFQEDRSISNRCEIWKVAPRMMVDAPGGWGIGKSGKAFTDWYQSLDRNETYRTLVNSHLTWLVELGWIGRFFYIVGWLALFILCVPSAQNRWLAVPLGIWLALFTGAIFSSVAESPWLWIVPGLAFLCVFVWRTRKRIWPSWKWLIIPPFLAASLLLSLAWLIPHSSFSKCGDAIMTSDSPSIWIVADKKVLGNSFAHSFRAAAITHPSLKCGIIENIHDLPEQTSLVIITGNGGAKSPAEICQKLKSAKTVLLINPPFFPDEFLLSRETSLRVIFGEFSQIPSASAWATRKNFERLMGVGDFIPDWTSKLLNTP